MIKKIAMLLAVCIFTLAPCEASKITVYSEDRITLYLDTELSGVTDDGVCVAYTDKVFPDGEDRVYIYGFQDGIYVKMNKDFNVEKSGSLSDPDFDAELANMVYIVFVKNVG